MGENIKRARDLSDNVLNTVLEPAPHKICRGFDGRTLREFIEDNFLENCTATELLKEFQTYGLKWPFRTLEVTVEVVSSRKFDVGCFDDDEVKAVDELGLEAATGFSIDDACVEVEDQGREGLWWNDHCVYDVDKGKIIFDWDD